MLFLKEFCVFSQTLQQQNRDNFFQALATHGILNVIQVMLVSNTYQWMNEKLIASI